MHRLHRLDLGRAIRYLSHYKKHAFLAYLFLFISTGAMLMVPQLMQRIINAVTNGVVAKQLSAVPAAFLPMALQKLGWTAEQYTRYGDGAESALTGAGWLIVAFAVMRGFFAYARTFMSERVSQSVAFDFRNDLFAMIQRLSTLNTILQENLAGIKVIKAFAREPQQQRRFDASAEAVMEQNIKVSRIFSFIFPLVFLIMNLGQAALQYFGGRQMILGTLTLGEWQKFTMYLMYVFFPLGMLGMIINQMAQASASAKRVFEIMDATNDVVNKPDAQDLPFVTGRVEFKDVGFRYFGSGEPVLKDVNFVAEPGQTVALLGATGSGKSSIINLIPRFYDATSGAVLIDGHDVRDVCLDSLRAQIGIVLQDTTLFTGSIRQNIAFGRPSATLDEVIAVAKAALAHEFITGFPQGYDTRVGERGTHTTLLAKKGAYYALYMRQFRQEENGQPEVKEMAPSLLAAT